MAGAVLSSVGQCRAVLGTSPNITPESVSWTPPEEAIIVYCSKEATVAGSSTRLDTRG